MSLELIPRSLWSMPSRLPSFLDEDDTWASFLPASGLTISEDEHSVFVEAAMPGLTGDQIEVTFDKGVLWLRGSANEEETDKKKKFYRKASSSFSYRLMVPGKIDENQEPTATYKNGVMKVVFQKIPESMPKKITVKEEQALLQSPIMGLY